MTWFSKIKLCYGHLWSSLSFFQFIVKLEHYSDHYSRFIVKYYFFVYNDLSSKKTWKQNFKKVFKKASQIWCKKKMLTSANFFKSYHYKLYFSTTPYMCPYLLTYKLSSIIVTKFTQEEVSFNTSKLILEKPT